MTGVDDEQAKALIMKAREHWFTDLTEPLPPTTAPARHAASITHRQDPARNSTMAVTTVAQLAAELNRSAAALLEQLQSAGVSKASTDDSLTETDKERLLDYLRTAHGTAGGGERKKITLTRKSTSEIKQADSSGKARTIQVEVRKKRTFVKRDDIATPAEEAALAPAPTRPNCSAARKRRGPQAEQLRRQEEELAEKRRQREEQERARPRGRRGARRARPPSKQAAAAAAAAAAEAAKPRRRRRRKKAAAKRGCSRRPPAAPAAPAPAEPAKPALRVIKAADGRERREATRSSTWPSAARPPRPRPRRSAR